MIHTCAIGQAELLLQHFLEGKCDAFTKIDRKGFIFRINFLCIRYATTLLFPKKRKKNKCKSLFAAMHMLASFSLSCQFYFMTSGEEGGRRGGLYSNFPPNPTGRVFFNTEKEAGKYGDPGIYNPFPSPLSVLLRQKRRGVTENQSRQQWRNYDNYEGGEEKESCSSFLSRRSKSVLISFSSSCCCF